MKKDYYLMLHLTPEATTEEIRAAYRRRALEVHPDQLALDRSPFLELQEAYAVLSDPTRRTVYDRKTETLPISHADPSQHRQNPPSNQPEVFKTCLCSAHLKRFLH